MIDAFDMPGIVLEVELFRQSDSAGFPVSIRVSVRYQDLSRSGRRTLFAGSSPLAVC